MQVKVIYGFIIGIAIPMTYLFVMTEHKKDCEIYIIPPKENIYQHLPYNVSKDPNFDYKKEMDQLNKERVKPDDPRLVRLIRNYYIEPPSNEPYRLQDAGRRDQSYGQAVFVDGTLRNMEDGFFVDSGAHDGEIQSNTLFFERIRHWTGILIEPQPEIYRQLKSKHRKSFHLNACVSVVPYPSKEGGFFVDSGAHDGEIQSNTLFFERIRHWTGILIEPQPEIYRQLKSKHRKSFHLNACVSVVPYPSKVQFLPTSFYGKMVENITKEDKWIKEGFKQITVQCFPLYSILLAMNQLTVDYFSLDVEGAEEGIINNIPLDRVKIRTISIEYDKVEGGADRLKTIMKQKGFNFLVKMESAAARDCIFYK